MGGVHRQTPFGVCFVRYLREPVLSFAQLRIKQQQYLSLFLACRLHGVSVGVEGIQSVWDIKKSDRELNDQTVINFRADLNESLIVAVNMISQLESSASFRVRMTLGTVCQLDLHCNVSRAV